MNLINLFCFVSIAIVAWSEHCIANEDVGTFDGWTTFGKKEERDRFANCFMISYPNQFTVDSASGISPSLDLGKNGPIPEENLHTLILRDEKNSLEVRASSYGFLAKEFYEPRGFKSPREVILTDFCRNAMCTKIISTQKYDLFYTHYEAAGIMSVIYLNRKADWGQCYQSLTFVFRNGTTLEDHKRVVETIIAKFIPSFARSE